MVNTSTIILATVDVIRVISSRSSGIYFVPFNWSKPRFAVHGDGVCGFWESDLRVNVPSRLYGDLTAVNAAHLLFLAERIWLNDRRAVLFSGLECAAHLGEYYLPPNDDY